jgi:hypothetical protein
MIVLFLSITGFLIYRYQNNQRRYLKTLTRTIYDTFQKSSYNTPYPSIAQGLDRSSVSDSHHHVAYVYK